MNQEVYEYIQRQLSLGKDRLWRYVVNPNGINYPKRSLYPIIDHYVQEFLSGDYEQKRWVIIPGLRGVGKTTILAQIYFALQKQGNDLNVLYISLDELTNNLGSNLQELLAEYERILGESYEALTKPTLLLLDEVQSDPKWASVLKSLNDRSQKVFLLCSGSSAIHLQDNADVAGRRAAIEKLYPMNFGEFGLVKYGIELDSDLKSKIKSALFDSADSASCYKQLQKLELGVNQYWTKLDPAHWNYYLEAGSLPFALTEKKLQNVYDAVLAMVDKVITKDIQQLGKFSVDTLPAIKRLLFILAESDAISNIKLGEVLGVSQLTVADILEVLVQAELLIRIPAYGSQIGATKKPSKYLFMSPAIRAAFYNISGSAGTYLSRQGKLLEDVLGMYFFQEFDSIGRGAMNYDPIAGGADFVLKLGQEQIIIEIGRGEKTGRQVANTMGRITAKYGLVVSKTPLSVVERENIVMVPREMFVLS